jgi:hypothetical protein
MVRSRPPGKDKKGYGTESIFSHAKGLLLDEQKACSHIFLITPSNISIGGNGDEVGF